MLLLGPSSEVEDFREADGPRWVDLFGKRSLDSLEEDSTPVLSKGGSNSALETNSRGQYKLELSQSSASGYRLSSICLLSPQSSLA